MNFQQYPVTKTVEIDGQVMIVPINTKFVTRDFTNTVKAWIVKPYCDEGWWCVDRGQPEGVTIGESIDSPIACYEV